MKHTLKYLKIIVFVFLFAIMLASFVLGLGTVLIGFFTAIAQHNPKYFLLILVGLFFGLLGFAALDALEYINDKWSWK